jgi:NADH-quinone oxidoreductase subunit C
MVCEKTKLALQQLFPPPTVVEEAPSEASEDGEVKKQEKVEPRSNGVIERDYKVHGYHIDAQVDPNQLLTAVQILDDAEFFLEAITGVDWIKTGQMEVIYDFSRYDFDVCRVVIRTRVDREQPEVPTITGIYAGASWHERETHEFFGIKFAGHPYLVPLLLPEDADFHPLRKDFKA